MRKGTTTPKALLVLTTALALPAATSARAVEVAELGEFDVERFEVE